MVADETRIPRTQLSGRDSVVMNGDRPRMPPPPRRSSSFAGSTIQPLPGEMHQSPVVPVFLITGSTVASWALWAIARAAGAGHSVEVHGTSVAGWVLGGVVSAVLLAWFRSVDLARRSSTSYTEQPWKPALVAGAVALAGWLASIAHAWSIASSVARR